jgi:hypothetical protein
MDGSTLRSEIIESQKSVFDLLKWKIILIAAVGATAFGVLKEKRAVMLELLALIPLVCAYVDALVYHDGLRMMLISQFLRGMKENDDGLLSKYETHCAEHRDVFYLEITVLIGTSILLCVGVGAVPAPGPNVHMLLKLSAILGIGVLTVLRIFYEVQKDRLNQSQESVEVGKKKKACWGWTALHIACLLLLAVFSIQAIEKLHKMWLDSRLWPVPAAGIERPGEGAQPQAAPLGRKVELGGSKGPGMPVHGTDPSRGCCDSRSLDCRGRDRDALGVLMGPHYAR